MSDILGFVGIIYFGTFLIINIFRVIEVIKSDKLIMKLRHENRQYLVDNEMLLRKLETAKIFNKDAEKLKQLIKTKAIVESSDLGYNIIIKCNNEDAGKFFDFIHEEYEIPEDGVVLEDDK